VVLRDEGSTGPLGPRDERSRGRDRAEVEAVREARQRALLERAVAVAAADLVEVARGRVETDHGGSAFHERDAEQRSHLGVEEDRVEPTLCIGAPERTPRTPARARGPVLAQQGNASQPPRTELDGQPGGIERARPHRPFQVLRMRDVAERLLDDERDARTHCPTHGRDGRFGRWADRSRPVEDRLSLAKRPGASVGKA